MDGSGPEREPSLHSPPTEIRLGGRLELRIDSVAYGGAGVARHDGFVVLVDRALPGDRVSSEITHVTPRFARARILELLSPSRYRRPPPCRHASLCGGCAYQAMEDSHQALAKEEQVRELLKRIARIPSPRVAPIIVGADSLHYRRRMSFEIPPREGAGPGLHRWDDPSQGLEVPGCLLPESRIQRAYARLLEEIRSLRAHQRPRHLELQAGSGEAAPLALLRGGGGLSGEFRRRAGSWVHPEGVLSGVVWAPGIPSGRGRRPEERLELLAGEGTVEEELCGFKVRIPAGGFFQANPRLAGVMFEEMARRCGDRSASVLELYSGVGMLTLLLAREGRKVVAVEGNREAMKAARENGRLNGQHNIRWKQEDVRRVLQVGAGETEAFDQVVLDPPRSGLPPDSATGLARLARKQILYLSCNPSTLARDIRLLLAEGDWELEEAIPADFFPQTAEIECLAVLKRVRGL